MSYIGAEPTTAAFPFDQFSGNGTTTNFTLTYAPASVSSIIVSISGVVQNPNTYAVTGTTLNLTPAPPTGTNNIAVLYLGLPVIGVSSPGNTAYFSQSVFTATASQTVFTPSGTYQVGFLNVIRNGSTLAPADYTATNGTTVTLLNPCTAGDTVVIQVFNLVSIANALPATGGTVTGATTFNSTVQVNGANVSGFTGFKNRIINPGMVIDQRNAGASVSVSNGTIVYGVDRFLAYEDTSASSCTVQRVTDAPAGFTNSLRFTVGTGGTATAAQLAVIDQAIEGFNFADFSYGTASAQTATLSFWVKSSLTGTYCIGLRNASDARSYVAQYTISAANTWELKTITFVGDTTGTWATDNGRGITVRWDLGSGSNYRTSTLNSWQAGLTFSTSSQANLIGTTGATFQITGVQLERGSNATSFEFRDYGRELILCQRYYEAGRSAAGSRSTDNIAIAYFAFKVTKRAIPTMTVSAGINLYTEVDSSSFYNSVGASNTYAPTWTAAIEL